MRLGQRANFPRMSAQRFSGGLGGWDTTQKCVWGWWMSVTVWRAGGGADGPALAEEVDLVIGVDAATQVQGQMQVQQTGGGARAPGRADTNLKGWQFAWFRPARRHSVVAGNGTEFRCS